MDGRAVSANMDAFFGSLFSPWTILFLSFIGWCFWELIFWLISLLPISIPIHITIG